MAGIIDEQVVVRAHGLGQVAQVLDNLQAAGLAVGAQDDTVGFEPVAADQGLFDDRGVLYSRLESRPFGIVIYADDQGVVGTPGTGRSGLRDDGQAALCGLS